jgi:hypothetical protein
MYEESQQISPALPVAVELAGVRELLRRNVEPAMCKPTPLEIVGFDVPIPT